LFAVARAECRQVLDLRVAAVLGTDPDPYYPAAVPISVSEPALLSGETIDLFAPLPALTAGGAVGAISPASSISQVDSAAAGVGGVGDPVSLDEIAGPDSTPEAVDETSYANHLVLELGDRQQLPPAEVGLAIGVPTVAAGPALARARRANRSAHGALLGPGRVFAPEMAAIRASVLAAADAGPAVATTGWLGGWPPPDPAFGAIPLVRERRRWGAPLAALVVLLIALGAIFGLLATTGGGHKSSGTSAAVVSSTSAATNATPLPTVGSSTAAPDPTGSGPGGPLAVAPPTPSQPSTAATTPTTSASGTLTLIVTTDKQPVMVRAGTVGATCAAKKSCPFVVASGAVIAITDALRGGPGPALRLDKFSAPASCVNTPGACIFVITSNLSIKLTTPAR
jgi:hypothetical protein